MSNTYNQRLVTQSDNFRKGVIVWRNPVLVSETHYNSNTSKKKKLLCSNVNLTYTL